MAKMEFNEYDKKVHRLGWITTFIAVVALALVPFLTQKAFSLQIDGPVTLKTLLTALTVFAPVAICEFISYVPILGAGGLYIAFVTGNVMNMKLPAGKNAQKICNVEAGTPEAEAVATLAAAVSTITTTLILTLGMILITQVLPLLKSPVLAPAFNNILPAIFAAIALPVFVKSAKSASVPVAVTVLLVVILGYSRVCSPYIQFWVLPSFLIFAVLWEYVLYRRAKK